MRPSEVHITPQMFGSHHVISPAIRFARDDRDFGHGAFRIRIQQFRTVFDDATEFLRRARHEPWHIDKSNHWDVERIAKTDKATCFDAALDIQTTGQHQGLVRHDADRLASHASKTNQDVFGVLGLQLKKITIVHCLQNQLFHVVRHVRVVRHQRVQAQVHALGRVAAGPHGRLLAVIQRQVVVETSEHQQRFNIVVECQVSNATFGGVGDGATQVFRADLFVGHRLHDIRPRDKHVRTVFDHEDEIGQSRRVNRTARRWAHDHADLRNHATGHHIALEHFGIASQRSHAFLDTCAT